MCIFGLSGCGAGYLMQAAKGQWQVLRKRQSIDTLLADEHGDAQLKARLATVRAARDFASRELGLPDNLSYRTYSALGRPYVVWNVVAAPEFSVQPRRWCFPITGCIAYRGYFREENARRYAGELQLQGFDVLVAGVSAYSTLGRFADPVLDTMMRYGELELVAIIFHELAHQVIYVKNDTAFNESFAVAVEQEGLSRWLSAHRRSAEFENYLQRRERLQGIVTRFAAGRQRLSALYAEPLADAEKRLRKQQLLADLTTDVRAYQTGLQLRSGYDAWLDAGLNNAHLASIATYHDCVPAFQRLLTEQRGDMPAFYAAVKRLGRQPAAQRQAFCASRQP
jgi:predicted aminopeptidase